MNLKLIRFTLSIAAAGVLLGGCGGGGNGSSGIPPITSVNPLQTGKLEFAVGTANVFGTASGLNVVATYRQSNGLSNVLVDTPTITGPFTVPGTPGTPGLSFDPLSTLPGGPSSSEIGAPGTIEGTPQGFSNTALSTFGQSGGVFVNGLSPGNSNNGGVADSYVPYTEPLYNASTTTTFVPWGGPPAFDPDKNGMGLRDGQNNLGAGVLGIPEGFTTFQGVIASAGSYKLSLVVPTGFSGSTATTGTVSATATIASTTKLPTLTATALTLDGSGGGTITLPAGDFAGGITEVYVEITDTGNGAASNCQGVLGAVGGAGPVYYTIVAKAAGTYTLPDKDGPNTNTSGGTTGLSPSESICTAAANAGAGDSYSVQLIGTDYDMYGATYPISKSQAPTLAGANGQADITISLPVTATST